MKFSGAQNWSKDFDYDGLLYFSQRVEEMLYNYTTDLYRTPLLNTHLLINEYLDVSIKVEKNETKENQLEIIFDEFKDSFKNDVVLKKYWGMDNINYVLNEFGTSPKISRKSIMKYLQVTFGEKKYFDWCCDYLKEIVQKSKSKKEIEAVTRLFIPEVIHSGYTPEYVYRTVKHIFSETPVNGFEAIDNFIDTFNFKPLQFVVYCAVPKTFIQFKDIIEKRLSIDFQDDGYFANFHIRSDQVIVKCKNITALDDYSAVYYAYNSIELFLRFYRFIGDHKSFPIGRTAMVRKEDDGNLLFLPCGSIGYSIISDSDSASSGELAEELITGLLGVARSEIPTLIKAIDMHNDALVMRDLKSGFLNLWAILEVISPETNKQSKLQSVLATLVPILEKDFIMAALLDIEKNLNDNCPEAYRTILDKETFCFENDSISKLAYLIMLPEYNDYRLELYQQLKEFPVIRSRISQMCELCSSTKKLKKRVEDYKQRVTWHLYRMYRARNGIIHSGDVPKDIKYLGEHLHMYVDGLLNEVIIKLTTTNLHSIDNVLVDTSFAVTRFEEVFSKDMKINKEIIDKILSPELKSLDKKDDEPSTKTPSLV